jgi:cbb3-type cytochrome oxidase subunit 1
MTSLSDRFLRLGVLFGLGGMGLGAWMGATENIVLTPVHAHVNLLGWVSMLLYGLVYRAIPSAAEGKLPVIHFWLNLASLLLMTVTLTLYLLGDAAMSPILGVSSVGMWLSMLVFTIIVFKATRSAG